MREYFLPIGNTRPAATEKGDGEHIHHSYPTAIPARAVELPDAPPTRAVAPGRITAAAMAGVDMAETLAHSSSPCQLNPIGLLGYGITVRIRDRGLPRWPRPWARRWAAPPPWWTAGVAPQAAAAAALLAQLLGELGADVSPALPVVEAELGESAALAEKYAAEHGR